MNHTTGISFEQLTMFQNAMRDSELAPATVGRYMGIAIGFAHWVGQRALSKQLMLEWREQLVGSTATVNVSVAAVNRLLRCLGMEELRIKQLRAQRSVFCAAEKELTREEYERLVAAAERQGRERLARAIETICALGLRVSELRYVTVEALERREITIRNKGKTRTVLLNAALVRKLRGYCRKRGLTAGPVFVTRSGRALTRTQLWAEMKALCAAAGVEPRKVFPHNLRHLFAVTYYRQHKDVVRLADLLGHSSVNTTRIYLKTSGAEHRRDLDAMGLVLPDEAA